MYIALILYFLPYCEPIRNETQAAQCLRYMMTCIQKRSEEQCVESMPEEFWPK